mmetsp:Transcript_28564/g.47417  ORF Transcript_28564/g.47417 Transcript_28564/m.47417 type:complete len:88 (-) Transcript_28564:43-306(-)
MMSLTGAWTPETFAKICNVFKPCVQEPPVANCLDHIYFVHSTLCSGTSCTHKHLMLGGFVHSPNPRPLLASEGSSPGRGWTKGRAVP